MAKNESDILFLILYEQTNALKGKENIVGDLSISFMENLFRKTKLLFVDHSPRNLLCMNFVITFVCTLRF